MDTTSRAGAPLRVSDLVPLRRMLGARSMVIRVNPDGSLVPFELMPALFYGRSIRRVLSDEVREEFERVCAAVIETGSPVAFTPTGFGQDDEVMITPTLDDDSSECRFLVCWARSTGSAPVIDGPDTGLHWEDLHPDDVVVRYRTVGDVIEAEPWWKLNGREPVQLWAHHRHVSAMGLGQAVMTALIFDATEAVAAHTDGPSVRIGVPSADLLMGLIPTFHGALRATALAAERVIVAVPVELAADPDLLPIIVHLRTMGLQIDIVGLDALTATLHTVSDTSDHRHQVDRVEHHPGDWTASPEAALAS